MPTAHSLTPKADRRHTTTGPDVGWYRNPALLAGLVLAITILLNITF